MICDWGTNKPVWYKELTPSQKRCCNIDARAHRLAV